MLKLIRRQMLKSDYWRKAVADYKRRQKEQTYKERWARLMRSGGMIR